MGLCRYYVVTSSTTQENATSKTLSRKSVILIFGLVIYICYFCNFRDSFFPLGAILQLVAAADFAIDTNTPNVKLENK